MDGNPLLGVFFHWLGGLSSASFYVPYKRIRRWSWEIFWLTGGSSPGSSRLGCSPRSTRPTFWP